MPPPSRIAAAVFLVLLAGFVCGCSSKTIPPDVRKALETGSQFEIFSLDPNSRGEKSESAFHGRRVLGKTAVEDAATRKKLVSALQQGVREHDGSVANCFNPRHGIRVVHEGATVDLVICFECYQVQSYAGGQSGSHFLVSRSPQTAFDQTLRDAAVPLP
jgi:hypothetical protein